MSSYNLKGSVRSSSSLSECSEYDPNFDEEPLIKESSNKLSLKGENAIEKKEKCRYCLKRESSKRNIKRHVKREHKKFYDKYRSKKSKYFIAEKGQTIPDDPSYQF